jgi:hypothetical protein
MFIVVMVANKPHRINLENILYYFEFAETGQAVFKLITGELFPTSTQIAEVMHFAHAPAGQLIVFFGLAIECPIPNNGKNLNWLNTEYPGKNG